jgi:hypothetical protein
MRKSINLFLSLASIVGITVGISSCKDDEPTKYTVTFAETTMTVTESDFDVVEIVVNLDKPAPDDITIDYKIEGTALEYESAGTQDYPDYALENVGELEIEKGETSGVINMQLISDIDIEEDETIILTLEKADVEHVTIAPDTKLEITLKQEDGMVVVLEWPEASTTGLADMDLFVRVGATSSNVTYDGLITGSAFHGYQYNYEYVFIPQAYTGDKLGLTYTNTTYGMTYTYYDGTLDPLDFNAIFIDFVNGQGEPEDQQQTFPGSYTAANKNKWVGSTYPTIIAQTFQNNGTSFSNISAITKQATSSRIATNSFAEKFNTNNRFILRSSGKELPLKFRKQFGIR